MNLRLLSGGAGWVIASSFSCAPVGRVACQNTFPSECKPLLSSTSSAPLLVHCWSALLPSLTSSAHSPPSIHLALSPPLISSPLSIHLTCFLRARSLSFLPPPSHYLRAPRTEQRVSGITPTLWGAAAIQVKNENIRAHTQNPTHTHARSHPETLTTILFHYLIIYKLSPNMLQAFLLATLKIHRAGSLLNVISFSLTCSLSLPTV